MMGAHLKNGLSSLKKIDKKGRPSEKKPLIKK